MAEEIPVYLFTGFMDSGKTSLIKDTIFENDFANGSKGLIIMCEDGMWSSNRIVVLHAGLLAPSSMSI